MLASCRPGIGVLGVLRVAVDTGVKHADVVDNVGVVERSIQEARAGRGGGERDADSCDDHGDDCCEATVHVLSPAYRLPDAISASLMRYKHQAVD